MISQGRTAEIFDIGNNQILKLFRKGFPLEAVEEEAAVMEMLKGVQVRVPEYFGRRDEGERRGLVYEKISGISMLSLIFSNPMKAKKYFVDLAEIQYKIHQEEIKGIYSLKDRLNFCISNSDLLSADKKEAILGELEELPDGRNLCHGDFHPDNILYSNNEAVVIDWMTAASGSPAADLARTAILLKYSEPPTGIKAFMKIALYFLKKTAYKTHLNHYLKISKVSKDEIDRWILPVAAARLYEGVPVYEKEVLLKLINKRLKKL